MRELIIPKCLYDIERMQREVNLLIISDLHYDISRRPHPSYPQGEEINSRLVESIPPPGDDWQPDIVLIAGDLVNQCREENYSHFFDLIEKLIKRFPTLKNSLFCTPGNHDVNRPDKDNYSSLFEYLDIIRNGKQGPGYAGTRNVNHFFALARNPILDNVHAQEALVKYEEEYFRTYLGKQVHLYDKIVLEPKKHFMIDGIKTTYHSCLFGINLVCYNSSYFCNLNGYQRPGFFRRVWQVLTFRRGRWVNRSTEGDRNNLFLILDLVKKLELNIPKTGPVISFMHHPYFFLNESEYISAIEGENEIYNCFSRILRKSDVVVSGHIHGDLQDPTLQQQFAYLITNGTSYTQSSIDNKSYPYTYAILKVNKQRQWFAMKKFIYSHSKKAYLYTNQGESRHYNFMHREQPEAPNLEAEKLRLIDHILEESKSADGDEILQSYIWQLGLYEDKYRFSKDEKDKKIKLIKNSEAHIISLLITDYEGKNPVQIFIVENWVQVQLHFRFLEPDRNSTVRYYYSLSRTNYMNGKLILGTKVKSLLYDYRYLVLCGKKERVGINILYH